jgi:thioredoxin-like negative regulator of GroEL
MSQALDPWLDAQAIAQRLAQPDAELVVVIGAQGWCEKCRRLRPAFDRLAANRQGLRDVWLWLDLEEHADFFGGYIPDDLPLLLQFRAGRLLEWGVAGGFDEARWQIAAAPARADRPAPLWDILTVRNWAN